MNTNSDLWIGLATVTPRTNNTDLGSCSGAYVNVLAMANNAEQFYDIVIKELNKFNFELQEMQELEKFNNRNSIYEIDEELCKLAEETITMGVVNFGVFHTFDSDDA